MAVGGLRDPELREDVADVRLDRPGAEDEPLADGLVRASLGHQRKHFLRAVVRQLSDRALVWNTARNLTPIYLNYVTGQSKKLSSTG